MLDDSTPKPKVKLSRAFYERYPQCRHGGEHYDQIIENMEWARDVLRRKPNKVSPEERAHFADMLASDPPMFDISGRLTGRPKNKNTNAMHIIARMNHGWALDMILPQLDRLLPSPDPKHQHYVIVDLLDRACKRTQCVDVLKALLSKADQLIADGHLSASDMQTFIETARKGDGTLSIQRYNLSNVAQYSRDKGEAYALLQDYYTEHCDTLPKHKVVYEALSNAAENNQVEIIHKVVPLLRSYDDKPENTIYGHTSDTYICFAFSSALGRLNIEAALALNKMGGQVHRRPGNMSSHWYQINEHNYWGYSDVYGKYAEDCKAAPTNIRNKKLNTYKQAALYLLNIGVEPEFKTSNGQTREPWLHEELDILGFLYRQGVGLTDEQRADFLKYNDKAEAFLAEYEGAYHALWEKFKQGDHPFQPGADAQSMTAWNEASAHSVQLSETDPYALLHAFNSIGVLKEALKPNYWPDPALALAAIDQLSPFEQRKLILETHTLTQDVLGHPESAPAGKWTAIVAAEKRGDIARHSRA